MNLGSTELIVGEDKLVTVNYEQWLRTNETLLATSASVSPTTSPPLTVIASVADTKNITVLVSGGMGTTNYVVTVVTTTLIDQAPDPSINQTKIDCFGVEATGGCD